MSADAILPRLPRTAALSAGRGGQPRLLVDAPAASAEIYLFGAHVTAWTPQGGRPVLFISRRARFDGETSIRGGVPLCLPWFTAGPRGTSRPKHGWARIMNWTLRSVEATSEGGVRALLSLDHDAVSALYDVTVGKSLTMSLSLRNAGNGPRLVEAALHTYLSVHDVTACVLTGLEGAEYSEEGGCGHVQSGPLRIAGAVDRIYRSESPVRVTDPGHDRAITVSGTGSPTTIVWNPWSQAAAGMSDVGEGEWQHFVCVETGAVRERALTLWPGHPHIMTQTLAVETLD